MRQRGPGWYSQLLKWLALWSFLVLDTHTLVALAYRLDLCRRADDLEVINSKL